VQAARGVLWGTSPQAFALGLLAIPTASAWLALEVMTAIRPVRRLHRANRNGPRDALARVALGACAGVAHVVLAGVLLAFSRERLLDEVVILTAGVIAGGTLALFMSRAHEGCPRCGYDRRGLRTCPECGLANSDEVSAVARTARVVEADIKAPTPSTDDQH
jgi:ribosomal protein S27AE